MGKGAFAAVLGQAMRALPACCREGAHGEKGGMRGKSGTFRQEREGSDAS